MNYEKKLEYFADVIFREVAAKKQRIKHQAANSISEDTATALEAAEDRANFQIEAAKRKLLREINIKISIATKEARAALGARRDIISDDLMQEAAAELVTFTQAPGYEAYLISRITQARQKGRGFTSVKLSPRDMRFAVAVRQATGLSTVEGEGDYIGGFVLQSASSRADHTFKTRLEKCVKGGISSGENSRS